MAVSLSRRTGAVAFLAWIWDGLDRTIFTAIKFSFPARFVSPFGFLGMLTFITFVILGISGALLMFYYEPILDRAWDSVEFINNDVPFGFHIRNIHYRVTGIKIQTADEGFGMKFPHGTNGAKARPVPAAPISFKKSRRERPLFCAPS